MTKINYLRVGDWHPSETSRIYSNGGDVLLGTENGVSVYPVIYKNNKFTFLVDNESLSADLHMLFMSIDGDWNNKPAYILDGDVIGYGMDNEPLLKNITIIKDVTKDLSHFIKKSNQIFREKYDILVENLNK